MIRNKILSWSLLRRRLKRDRLKRRKIVFTNGVFDLFHSGHLKVFDRCKKWGKILVVGINSDKSVRTIKGPRRPILNQKDRAKLLAALEVVDYVVVFNQSTPERLIQYLKPDILVKGGDWKSHQIVGREWVKKVVRVPLLKGHSTTNLIDLILRRYGHKKKS